MNKHGLARDIPEDIKRQVRRECGNGCVLCGILPYDYEHFDPPFVDAKEHRAEGIALLCDRHHRAKQMLGTADIAAARLAPYNAGKSAQWQVELGRVGSRTLVVGNNKFVVEGVLSAGIVLDGRTLIALGRDETGAWLLSANLRDDDGRAALTIFENEAVIHQGLWDVTLEGKSLIIRSAPRRIVAVLSIDGDTGVVELERLNMVIAGGYKLDVDSSALTVSSATHRCWFDLSLSGNTISYGPGCNAPSGTVLGINLGGIVVGDERVEDWARVAPARLRSV